MKFSFLSIATLSLIAGMSQVNIAHALKITGTCTCDVAAGPEGTAWEKKIYSETVKVDVSDKSIDQQKAICLNACKGVYSNRSNGAMATWWRENYSKHCPKNPPSLSGTYSEKDMTLSINSSKKAQSVVYAKLETATEICIENGSCKIKTEVLDAGTTGWNSVNGTCIYNVSTSLKSGG